MQDAQDDRSGPGTAGETPSVTSVATRFVEIDTIKAVGILTVVLIHAIRAPWDPRSSALELWLGIVTRFAVPGFVFCSGFLYATTRRIDNAVVAKRLRRVLVPYLICSAGAQIWWSAVGQAHPADEMFWEILLGSSFGPFYYVFVHFFLVLFAPLFVRLSNTQLAVFTALMILTQASLESSVTLALPLFWHVRSPLLWWGYFLLGWIVRLHYEAVSRWIVAHRSVLLAVLALAIVPCTWVAQLEDRTAVVRGAMWLDIYLILGLLFVSTCARRRAPAVIAALSDATFAIYLLHLFFVYTAERFVRPGENEFDVLVIGLYWGAGVLGALGVIAAARAIFGSRSRDVIGA